MRNIKNEEAVSPVIGVILMVVITVIVAAILAVFAFGIGAPVKAPETKLRFVADSGTDNFRIYHDGGDTLIGNDTRITIRNAITDAAVIYTNAGTYSVSDENVALFTNSSTLVAGRVYYNGTMTGPAAGDILRVVVMDVPTGQLISDAKITVQ